MAEVMVICEGQTEVKFIKQVLADYMAMKNVFLHPIELGKGHNHAGGNVQWQRVMRDIRNHFAQRTDSYISLLIDYYGIGKPATWPGWQEANKQSSARAIAQKFHNFR